MTPAPWRAPRGRWYAEVDRDGASKFRRPQVISRPDLEPEILPGVNGLPRLKLPVQKSTDWQAYRGADLRVWYDAVRQPVDKVEAVEQRADATILKGRGGLDLLDRQQLEVELDTASGVATDFLSNIPYTADVDAFDADVTLNETVQAADTQVEFEDAVPAAKSTDPYIIANGTVELQQAAFFFDTSADMTQTGTGLASDASYNDGNAEQFLDDGDALEGTFDIDYDIPSGSVGLGLRFESDDMPQVDVFLDGVNISTLNTGLTASLNWFFDGADFPDFAPGGISSGSHTIRLEQVSTSGNNLTLDCVVVYDTRYSWTFDNTVDANGYLSSPSLYPTLPIEFNNAEVAESVSGARFEGTFNDTTGDQEIGLSNDLSGGYVSSANTDTFETDFGDLGPVARARVTLAAYGSRTSPAPTEGFNGQELQSFALKADLDDTPLVVEQGFDGQTADLLTEVADLADAVWEYRIAEDGTETVTWTYPNQRSSDRDPDVEDWRYEETLEGAYDSVTVKGGARRAEDERFDANHGQATALVRDNLVTGSETVFDPGTTPLETFDRGTDYELDTIDGTITTLSGGSMTDQAEYGIDYRWRPSNTVDNGAADPVETVEDIPSVTTVRGAGQAALRILTDVDEPLKTGRVIIPATATDWQVTDALTPSVFPIDEGETVQLRDAETAPGQVVLEFETRRRLPDVVADVRSRLRRLSERS